MFRRHSCPHRVSVSYPTLHHPLPSLSASLPLSKGSQWMNPMLHYWLYTDCTAPLPPLSPVERPQRMNNILTSATEPYDLSLSRSFQNLSHLPPSYELALKSDLSTYSFYFHRLSRWSFIHPPSPCFDWCTKKFMEGHHPHAPYIKRLPCSPPQAWWYILMSITEPCIMISISRCLVAHCVDSPLTFSPFQGNKLFKMHDNVLASKLIPSESSIGPSTDI